MHKVQDIASKNWPDHRQFLGGVAHTWSEISEISNRKWLLREVWLYIQLWELVEQSIRTGSRLNHHNVTDNKWHTCSYHTNIDTVIKIMIIN